MKKLRDFSPLIAVAIVITVLIWLFAGGVFNPPEEILITSSSLTEVIQTAKLTTAKHIQHGIAKAHIDGKESGYILYYAIVKPNVDMESIAIDVNDDLKTVSVTIPDKFEFDVEILEDDNHTTYYYPDNKDDWTGKDVSFICQTDARTKAQQNTELLEKAQESLINTIQTLLNPILSKSEYELVFNQVAQ